MKVLLEDSWEALDIIDFCNKNDHECVVLSGDQLKTMDAKEFFKCAYFCNTDIVQIT